MDININKNIPSNQKMYEMLCDLTRKYELLQNNFEKSESKNKKTILLLNRQLLILKAFIDKYIFKFTEDIEKLKINELKNNININKINIEDIHSNLNINYKEAEKIIEKKFGPLYIDSGKNMLNIINKSKDIQNFENLLKSILDKEKNKIDKKDLKEFNKLAEILISQKILPSVIINGYFVDNINNKLRQSDDINNIEFVSRISHIKSEMLIAANNIELQLNNQSKKDNKKEVQKDNKPIDIIAEFRKEYKINEKDASDREIKKLLKANNNDMVKVFEAIKQKLEKKNKNKK